MGVGLAAVTLLIALTQGVSCKTWNMKLPQRIEAVGGSCVTVPCHFDVPGDEEANISRCADGGVWRKGSMTGPVVFAARNPSANAVQGEIVGDLTKKNCTTTFHSFPENYSDVYFFRLDCKGGVKFTFTNGVAVNIRAEPPPPVLTSVSQLTPVSQLTSVSQLTPVSQLTEGDQVRLQCSVQVPCSARPPSITWLPRDDSRQEETQMQQSADRLTTMTSTVTFIASADHHNQSVSCRASYPLPEGGSREPAAATRRLNVLYAPRVTVATLSPSSPVAEGDAVTFTCWSDANPPVSLYTWHRVHGGKLVKKGEGQLVLQVREEDRGVYLCRARAQQLSQWSRPVTLEVNAAAGVVELPYIMCGALLVLFITTVLVDVYKHQSISRRLKQIELKGEHTYADLRAAGVPSDYDRLQRGEAKAKASHEDHNYENPVVLQAAFNKKKKKQKAPPERT